MERGAQSAPDPHGADSTKNTITAGASEVTCMKLENVTQTIMSLWTILSRSGLVNIQSLRQLLRKSAWCVSMSSTLHTCPATTPGVSVCHQHYTPAQQQHQVCQYVINVTHLPSNNTRCVSMSSTLHTCPATTPGVSAVSYTHLTLPTIYSV